MSQSMQKHVISDMFLKANHLLGTEEIKT